MSVEGTASPVSDSAGLEALLAELDRLPGLEARETARSAVRAVLDFHTAGLSRMLQIAQQRTAGAEHIVALAADPRVSALLLLHGLHPLDLATRVRTCLATLTDELAEMDARVEVDAIESDSARLRLSVAHDDRAISHRVRERVEQALCELAPDLAGVAWTEESLTAFVPVARLRRDPVESPRAEERCETCATTLSPEHDHLLNPANGQLRCACAACAIASVGESGTGWKRIQTGVEPLSDFNVSDAQWAAMQVPIDVAFFQFHSQLSGIRAHYPGPSGAIEAIPSGEAWTSLQAANPVLARLEPDVDALLVDRLDGRRAYYRVSVDVCYELVGLIRTQWRGLGGGPEVREAIRSYFEGLPHRRGGHHA